MGKSPRRAGSEAGVVYQSTACEVSNSHYQEETGGLLSFRDPRRPRLANPSRLCPVETHCLTDKAGEAGGVGYSFRSDLDMSKILPSPLQKMIGIVKRTPSPEFHPHVVSEGTDATDEIGARIPIIRPLLLHMEFGGDLSHDGVEELLDVLEIRGNVILSGSGGLWRHALRSPA